MSRSCPGRLGFGAIIVLGFVQSGRAQDAVPGGWASQAGVKSFGAPGDGGYVGFGIPVWNGLAPYGGYAGRFNPESTPVFPSVRAQPHASNALVPLSQAVRRATRKRSRR